MLILLFAYLWPHGAGDTLAQRFVPPPGAHRVVAGDFGKWLRGLPLFPPGTPVHLYDGSLKPRQDVHAAVVDLDVGARDLQQCADAIMRLRAEYLRERGRPVVFHPDARHALQYRGGDWKKYLSRLFAEAGSASLQAELPSRKGPVEPGDVLIQGGHPGHAVLVLDVAEGGGRRFLLLGQSYMPAQQFHVLENPDGGVWYDESALDGAGLRTPEWRPFFRRDVRRF